nr:unnamed protein product [Fasciola hepatica]
MTNTSTGFSGQGCHRDYGCYGDPECGRLSYYNQIRMFGCRGRWQPCSRDLDCCNRMKCIESYCFGPL